MRNSIWIGLVLTLIGILIGAFMQDINYIFKVNGTIGLVSLLLSGLFLGAFVSGDRMRANFNTETKEDRTERTNMSYRLLLIGLPNLITAITAYLFII